MRKKATAATWPTEASDFYVVDKDIVDRDEAALVCAVVLDVLRHDLAAAYVDAYSDYDDAMPQEVRDAQAALMAIGAAQHGRDPGMGIELDLSDPEQARLLGLFAPWSINVDLLGPDQMDLGGFHDCGLSVHFRATGDQANEATHRLKAITPVITMTAHKQRRRGERRAQRVARRTAITGRARAALRRVSRRARPTTGSGAPKNTPASVGSTTGPSMSTPPRHSNDMSLVGGAEQPIPSSYTRAEDDSVTALITRSRSWFTRVQRWHAVQGIGGWLLAFGIIIGCGSWFGFSDLHERNVARDVAVHGEWVMATNVSVHVDHEYAKGGGWDEVDHVRAHLTGGPDLTDLDAVANAGTLPDSIDWHQGWQQPTSATGYTEPLLVRVTYDQDGSIAHAVAKDDVLYWTIDNSDPEIGFGFAAVGSLAGLVALGGNWFVQRRRSRLRRSNDYSGGTRRERREARDRDSVSPWSKTKGKR